MKYHSIVMAGLIMSASASASDCNCDHIISDSVDAQEVGVLPGDLVCLDGSLTYEDGPLRWDNFIGTEDEPIIIKNCNGVAHINPQTSAYGWKFINSKYFKILGNGDPEHEYGIKVSTKKGFYLTMEYFTTDFEIAHIEIAGAIGASSEDNGFAGIGMKTSPYQDCDLFQDASKTAFLMDNVSVHNNYIHDVGGEGIYAGHGFYQGREESRCPEGVTTYAHNIHNLAIYDNYIADIGYDGIQVKNADFNAQIYGNVIRNYGLEGKGAHDEGIFIGDGFEGVVHSNWVENGPGHGFQINAFGNTKVYNNVVIDSEDDGIYLNNRSDSFANRDGVFEIYHNTFVNMGDDAIEAFTPQTITLANNIFVNFADDATNGFSAELESNLFEQDIEQVGFLDIEIQNYGLISNSIAIDSGDSVGVEYDYSGEARNDNLADKGAFEFGSLSDAPAVITAHDEQSEVSYEIGKLSLNPSMIKIITGNGEAHHLIDEQKLAGDPASGEDSSPVTYWKPTDGANSLPHTARITLDTAYRITEIYLYDANGKGELEITGRDADGATWTVSDPGSTYKKWVAHSVDEYAQFIDITRYGQNYFNEIVIYGHPKDSVAPEITLLGNSPMQIALNQSFIDPGALAFDNVDGDLTANIELDTTTLNLTEAGLYSVTYSVEDSSGNQTTVTRQIEVTAPKISLDMSMITLLNGNGEATNLVDEQTLVGDPAAGEVSSPSSYWKAIDGSATLPHTAQIDLGTDYRISAIYLYDTNGKGELDISGVASNESTWRVTDSGSKYNVWVSHTINADARYINITRYGQNYFNEIVIYGHPKNN